MEIAGLLALLSVGWHTLLEFKLTPGGLQRLRALFFLIVRLLPASHQSYVESFGFTMMAFHLRYLYDSAFILANALHTELEAVEDGMFRLSLLYSA